MTDLDSTLSSAWSRILPRLLADPAELRRRLDRRKSRLFARPLRAYCIALRANDRRIDDLSLSISPPHAIHPDAPEHPGRCIEHTLTLNQTFLKTVCQSVRIEPPGEPADVVAEKLGCTPRSLFTLRRNGFLRTTPKPGLAGRHGPPVPVLYCHDFLDPHTSNRAGADEIFANAWRTNYYLIPDGFSQTLTRIPVYRRTAGREQFRGWFWVCPCCRRSAQVLFYPVDHLDLPTYFGFAPSLAEPAPKPIPIFACRPCHGILGFSRVNLAQKWNILILRLSGGLLYGHEVEKPDFLTPRRQRPHHPRASRPAPSRNHVQRLLTHTDLTYPQIAARLQVSLSTIRHHVDKIYKRHHVHTRADLQATLRPPQSHSTSAAG